MSSVTPNLNLTLPVGEENVSRQIINENMQKIDTAYGNLQGGVMRKVPFSVTVGDWTLDDGVYVAEFATAYVTASSSEFAFYTASYSQYAVSDIVMDKKPGGGALVFTTADLPTGTIAGTLYVFDNNDGKIPVIMEDTVLPIANGGTGENTLAGAKNALGIEQLESDVADINAHLGTLDGKVEPELYSQEAVAGKYNGTTLYRRIFVSSSKTLSKDVSTEMMTGLPVPGKIVSMNVSYLISTATIYEVPDMYTRAYIDANGKLMVTQSIGASISMVARADVCYVH